MSSTRTLTIRAPVAGDRRATELSRADVVATLERAAIDSGLPKTIRLDNGPEFVSKELDLWAFMCGLTLDFSQPSKPTDNAIESFNGKFRTECLNANWFLGLDVARQKCEAWRRDDNDVRAHSSIGGKTPRELYPRPATPASRAGDEAGISRPDWSSVGGKFTRGRHHMRRCPISGNALLSRGRCLWQIHHWNSPRSCLTNFSYNRHLIVKHR
jgi:hypothetical protein